MYYSGSSNTNPNMDKTEYANPIMHEMNGCRHGFKLKFYAAKLANGYPTFLGTRGTCRNRILWSVSINLIIGFHTISATYL
jgi:hypothetical protein